MELILMKKEFENDFSILAYFALILAFALSHR